jgi:hypothetical protein
MAEWDFPVTWRVGDTLDAATLNARIRDPNIVLLRRPLTAVHNSADQTSTNAVDLTVSFDTIDNDDDGMVVTALPATRFVAQRSGTYQFWFNVTVLGNGTTGQSLNTSVWINGDVNQRRWDCYTGLTATTGKQYCRSTTGMLFLAAGEYLTAQLYQNSAAVTTVKALNGTPSFKLLWLGIS